MKTILLTLGVLVVASIGVFAVKGCAPGAARRIQFIFIGYTNTGGGPEALFSVRLPPHGNAVGFNTPEVSNKDGTVWNSPRNNLRMFNGPMPPPAAGSRILRPDLFAAISVESSNTPSRIIIKIDESPPSAPISLAAWNLGKKLGFEFSSPRGFSYFITNEIGVTTVPADR